MHYFLESAQWSYCQNVVQVYHGEKKRVIVNVLIYLKRNNFCGNLFSRIKVVDGKFFSWMSNNQACQLIRGESHIDFRTLFNH